MRCVCRLIAVLLAVVPAAGAELPRPPEVYVRENFEGRQTLEQLRRLEAEHRWGEAAEGYDRLFTASGDELARVDPFHYRRIGDVIHERISNWPAVARERYRTIVESRAARRLERLGESASAAELLAVARQYGLTPAGQEAGRRAVELLEREGRPEAAERWRGRLGMEVDVQSAEGGQEVQLSEGGQDARPPNRQDARPPVWHRRPAGEVGQEVQHLEGGQDARPPDGQDVRPPSEQDVRLPEPGEHFWSRRLPVEHGITAARPCELAAVGERVYAQTATAIYSVELNSGRIRWAFPPAGLTEAQAVLLEGCDGPPAAPVVAGGRVYANLTLCREGARAESRLVCLDAATGDLIWEAYALRPDLSGRFQPEVYFDGTPLLYEGSLYTVIRRQRELGFEDCRLVCLDPGTGEQRWEAWIASGPAGEGAARRRTRSDPAGWGGDVFVQTNVGAVASVEALTGQVRWVTLDPSPLQTRPAPLETRPGRRSPQQWSMNSDPPSQPVVMARLVAGGETRMLTVPVRSGDLAGYDVETGQEVLRVDRAKLGDFQYLMGPREGVIYAVGSRVVAWDLAGGREVWNVALARPPVPQTRESDAENGRPFLTDSRLWVPMRTGLNWFDLEDGRQGRMDWPASPLAGQPAIRGGNLLVTDGILLIGGAQSLHALTPDGGGLARLLARTQADSQQEWAWLDLARFALAHPAERARGLAALDRATRGITGEEIPAGMTVEDRARIAEEALDIVREVVHGLAGMAPPARGKSGFAATVGQPVEQPAGRPGVAQAEGAPAGDTDTSAFMDELLARAARLVLADTDRVNYRLSFAEAYDRMGRLVEAVRLLQQILDEPGLREVRVEQHASQSSLPAGRVAERRIDDLIGRYGRSVYAAFDARAEQWFEDHAAAGDPAELYEGLRRFPNANVFPDMLLAWLRQERQAGHSLRAARVARHALIRRRTVLDEIQAPLFAEIAASYLDAGDPLRALSWLNHGERDRPDAEWTVAGRRASFASIRERLRSTPVDGRNSASRIALPLEMIYTLERPDALWLRPRSDRLSDVTAGRSEPIVLFSEGVLEAIDSVSGQSMWKAPSVRVGTPAWLGTRDERLIFATRYQLFALEGRTGRLCWTVGEPAPLTTSPAIDPEILTRIDLLAFGETLAVMLRSDGRGVGTDLFSGEVLWEAAFPRKAVAGGPYALNEEYLIYVAQGEPPALVVLEAATGREVGMCALGTAGQVSWCGLTPEWTILVGGSNWLACFDARTQRERWRLDGLEARHTGLILPGLEGFLLPGKTSVEFRSYADGRVVWERDLAGVVQGTVLRTWLDDDAVYVLTGEGAAALNAADGKVRWSARWPDGLMAGPAWLASEHIVATGIRPVAGDDKNIRWQLNACWLDRETGRPVGTGCERLGASLAMPDVDLYTKVLLARMGQVFTAWAGDENPPGSIDRSLPEQ